MTIAQIKAKQYERLDITADAYTRHLIRSAGYLLVTEEELIELNTNAHGTD